MMPVLMVSAVRAGVRVLCSLAESWYVPHCGTAVCEGKGKPIHEHLGWCN